MNNNLKVVLISLVVAGAVFGFGAVVRDEVDLDALALKAAEKVNVPDAIRGEQGPRGLIGLKGDKGDNSTQGVQGVKGDKGDAATFNEAAFAEKYGLEVVVKPFNKKFSDNKDFTATFTVPEDDNYTFTLVSFVSSGVNVAVFKGSTQVKGFTDTSFNVNLDEGVTYTLFVESDGLWEVEVK